MGRFGNVLLIGGETDLALRAQLGEVVRFYFTNTANTRVFKVGLPGARMKLVGGDSGRHEHEEFVDDVLLAPSERVVVDVLFEERRRVDARAPHSRAYVRTRQITVDEEPAEPSFAESSRFCVRTRSWWPSASGSRPSSRLRRTRRSPSSPRWTRAARRSDRRLRLSDASRGRRPGRASARSAG